MNRGGSAVTGTARFELGAAPNALVVSRCESRQRRAAEPLRIPWSHYALSITHYVRASIGASVRNRLCAQSQLCACVSLDPAARGQGGHGPRRRRGERLLRRAGRQQRLALVAAHPRRAWGSAALPLRRGTEYLSGSGIKWMRGGAKTKIVQGWPKFWANFRAQIGKSSQSVGPSLAIWANPVQLSVKRQCDNAPQARRTSMQAASASAPRGRRSRSARALAAKVILIPPCNFTSGSPYKIYRAAPE
jgi:hypothetical protein